MAAIFSDRFTARGTLDIEAKRHYETQIIYLRIQGAWGGEVWVDGLARARDFRTELQALKIQVQRYRGTRACQHYANARRWPWFEPSSGGMKKKIIGKGATSRARRAFRSRSPCQ